MKCSYHIQKLLVFIWKFSLILNITNIDIFDPLEEFFFVTKLKVRKIL